MVFASDKPVEAMADKACCAFGRLISSTCGPVPGIEHRIQLQEICALHL